jgi:hypothetical protein
LSRELIPSEEFVNSPLQAISTTAFQAGSVRQVVGFASRELSRADREIELSNALASHRAYEPPSPTTQVKGGRSHRDDATHLLSMRGVPKPQAAPLRRPQIDFIADRADLLAAALPSNYSFTAARAVAPTDTPD